MSRAPAWFGSRNIYDIHTICYIREFLNYACSSYSQKVQSSNLSCSFDAYCEKTFRRSLALFVGAWKAFSDRTTFLIFDRDWLRDRHIVEDFFYHIDAKRPASLEVAEQNPSISGNLLGFKLLVNRYGLMRPSMYGPLLELAINNPHFRGRFYISDRKARELRRNYSFYNEYLFSIAEDVPLKTFIDGHAVPNRSTWSSDLEKILSAPGLSHLRQHEAIAKAKPRHVAEIF